MSRSIRRIAALVVAVVIAASGALTGCGSSDEPGGAGSPASSSVPIAPDVLASGTMTERPALQYEKPWPAGASLRTVLVTGQGAVPAEGSAVLLRVYAENADTGEVLRDDFADVPRAYRMTVAALGDDLYQSLAGVPVGSRVLRAATDATTGTSFVMTIDLLPISASGTPVAPSAQAGVTLPAVTLGDDGTPMIAVPADVAPPVTLTVIPLRRGDGVQVAAGSKVVLQYVAERWNGGEVFASTWADGAMPVTVTVGEDLLIEGIEQTLVEVPVGSQIMVIVPPELAYNLSGGELDNETLIYVFDVLAAPVAEATS